MTALLYGWVPQPNGRGTLDIIQNCLLTIFLCSWSVLFLNLPANGYTDYKLLKTKLRWMLFTILFPEMMTGIAAEQWRSARQSVKSFHGLRQRWEESLQSESACENKTSLVRNTAALKCCPWTMRHAFFADMGGLHLQCEDFVPFPIDSQQLLYLVEKEHVPYPDLKIEAIWDKNKADGFARALTLVQITWFFVQCVGRSVQHLDLTTFELSTLSFIFCTTITFFFWRHKPLDACTPIIILSPVKLEEVLIKADSASRDKYDRTPLDFVKPPISRSSLIAPFWFGFKSVFDWTASSRKLPRREFGNTQTTPPNGLEITDIVFGGIFTTGYSGIHLAGWKSHFPTTAEQMGWRISSLLMLGLSTFYFIAIAIGTIFACQIARLFTKDPEVRTIMGITALLPRWLAVMLHLPIIALYISARAYIIVEGFASLRALPLTAFATVNWSNFMPHV